MRSHRRVVAGASLVLLLFLTVPIVRGLESTAPGQASGADADAIRETLATLERGFREADLEVVMSVYTDDVFYSAPSSAPVIGKEALRASTNTDSPSNISLTIEEAMAHGDWGHALGPFSIGDAFTGKYLMIMAKEADGSWKIAREFWNADSQPADSQ